jgi:4-amino-4-deoxy-L-arabinose transferase-like glycosyltransferase
VELRGRTPFWILVAFAAVLLLARTWSVPLIDPDEPRFARTSVEMLESGDLVVPSFEWEPRTVKPPLMHWIQATVFRWLGASDLTARLPSLFATLGSMVIIGWVVRRRFGEEGALWAAAFFVTSPLVIGVGRLGTIDALLSVHVLAAFALDLAEPEEAGAYRTAAIGGLLGLAFLAKGPVGLVLPLLVILAGRTAAGRNVLPNPKPFFAFLAAISVVVLPWGLAFLKRIGSGSLLETLRVEVVDRYFSGTAHVEPPWYYGPVLLVGFVPWVAPMLVGLLRLFGRRKDPAARTGLYAAAGFIAGLLFLSLGKGKLPNYLLPLAPLVAILVTWELGQDLDDPRERTFAPTALAGTMVGFGFILILGAVSYLAEPAQTIALSAAGIYILGGLIAFAGVARRRPRWVYGTAVVTSYAFLLIFVTGLLPGLMETRSTRPLIDRVPELRETRPIVVVSMRVPSLVWYLERTTEKVSAADVGSRLDRRDRALYVVDHRDLPAVDAGTRVRLREIGRHGKYRVYEPAPPGRK